MKVLCIYPGMNPTYNDNFHALRHLRELGAELIILAGAAAGLKTTEPAAREEVASGIPIYRHWTHVAEMNSLSGRSLEAAEAIADSFAPDVVWCSLTDNRPLGRHLARRLDIPWIQLTESLFDAQMLMGQRMRFWRKPRLELGAHRLRRELLEGAQLILHSNPTEIERAARLQGPARVDYVPWCSEVPEDDLAGDVPRANTAIHVGSLHHFKNAQKLPRMIEQLMQQALVDKIEIVGPGPYKTAIEAMVRRHPETLSYESSIPRPEAIRRLRASRFAFTPTRVGGWGLFGDCWASRTPVLSLHDPYALQHGTDAYVVSPGESVGAAARTLCEDEALYSTLQAGGFARYQRDHTAEAVGQRYFQHLREVVGR